MTQKTTSRMKQQTHKELKHIMKTSLFKYTENFITKTWKFSYKNSDIFLISADKHRFRVLVRTASPMFFSRNKKNNVYPCKPQFNYIKVKGLTII